MLRSWEVAPVERFSELEFAVLPDVLPVAEAERLTALLPPLQPPLAVLESLLAVRVHLDPCPSDAGALRVVPGSHRSGRLGGVEAARTRAAQGETVVSVTQGAALLMRPFAARLLESSTRHHPPRIALRVRTARTAMRTALGIRCLVVADPMADAALILFTRHPHISCGG